MTKKINNTFFKINHPVCCGIDVHKASIKTCLLSIDADGNEVSEIKTFSTFTNELMKFRQWLLDNNCPIASMESTSVYWWPVYNILEDFIEVMLVNAKHIKNVPGRKTDIKDCQWISGLLKYGLLKSSFIPEKRFRYLRELITLRKSYSNTLKDYKRRTHKLFETANIKISSVVSDLFGVTGRNLMRMLCNPDADLNLKCIESCAKGSLKKKAPELYESIQGFFKEHHRFILIEYLDTIERFESKIAKVEKYLSSQLADQKKLIERLDEVYGIDKIAAQSIICHTGINYDNFKTDNSYVAWMGLAPGNNESAGKRKSGKTPVKKHPLKTLAVEIAWSAVKKKRSYYRSKYYRLKARRGAKKAIVAIANRIMKAVFHIIKYGTSFKDLGENYLSEINKSSMLKNLKKNAKYMGYNLVPTEK
jgi:transposase